MTINTEGMLILGGGSRIATAAKVAAKVAPNVVTGGVVAEAGPRPDFSLWTAEDDLLLANAMEVSICKFVSQLARYCTYLY